MSKAVGREVTGPPGTGILKMAYRLARSQWVAGLPLEQGSRYAIAQTAMAFFFMRRGGKEVGEAAVKWHEKGTRHKHTGFIRSLYFLRRHRR